MWFHTKKSKEKLKKPKLPILLTHPTFGDQNRVQNFFFTFLKKIFFSESWVCKDFLGVYHEKFSHWKFSGTERFTKKFCFSLISVSAWKKSIGLVYPNFLCHRPSQKLVWTVIPQTFQGYPRSWPGVNSLASRSSQSEVMPIFVA